MYSFVLVNLSFKTLLTEWGWLRGNHFLCWCCPCSQTMTRLTPAPDCLPEPCGPAWGVLPAWLISIVGKQFQLQSHMETKTLNKFSDVSPWVWYGEFKLITGWLQNRVRKTCKTRLGKVFSQASHLRKLVLSNFAVSTQHELFT